MRRTKSSFILILLFVVVGFSCRKDSCGSSPHDRAEIVGYDMTKCGCCGGYQFRIGNHTPPNGGNYFLAQTLPATFQVNITGPFPIPVKMEWELINPTVCNTFINVKKIERR